MASGVFRGVQFVCPMLGCLSRLRCKSIAVCSGRSIKYGFPRRFSSSSEKKDEKFHNEDNDFSKDSFESDASNNIGTPKLQFSMVAPRMLKIRVVGQNKTIAYKSVRFTDLEMRLQNTPKWFKWLPRTVKMTINTFMLHFAQRKYLGKDFDEKDFFYYAAMAGMTISDYVLKGDYNAVKELLSNEAEMNKWDLGEVHKYISDVHSSSKEDIIHYHPGSVGIYESVTGDSCLVRLTVFVLCKVNAVVRNEAHAPIRELNLVPDALSVSPYFLTLRRLACTLEQTITKRGEERESSDWRAVEFSQDLEIIHIPTLN